MMQIQCTVILSKPDGGYAQVRIGDLNWYHEARIYESNGSMHVAVQGFTDVGNPLIGTFSDIFVTTDDDFVFKGDALGFVGEGLIPSDGSTF